MGILDVEQPMGVSGLGQGRVCVKVQTKYFPKTGWLKVKIVPKAGSHTEVVIHKTG